MKRYFSAILGCVLIGISFNLFFLPYDLVPNGIYGLGALINYYFNYEPSLFLLIINVALLFISLLSTNFENTKKYILPSLLIPLIIFLSENITTIIHIDNVETILLAIISGVLTGYGYGLIFKEGFSVGGIDLLQDLFNSIRIYRRKTFSYVIELIIILLTAYVLGIESAMYSLISIVIIRYMATKSKVGISSSKTFFIITEMEKEVKNYIINDLKQDLTEFNVKGGFSNNKSKILMTAVDTKDYYRLKEGINIIDPKAFISIMDSYEVINKNITIGRKKKI